MSKRKNNTDTAAKVTDALIAMVEEAGHLPWHRPWRDTNLAVARSAVTGKAYRGINQWLLGMRGQMIDPSVPNVWATYKQIAAEGGQVRKGERSSIAVFFRVLEKRNDDGEVDRIPMMRTFNVFHWTQADWADGDPKVVRQQQALADAAVANRPDPHDASEALAMAYVTDDSGPSLRIGGDSASYQPAVDRVNVPDMAAFHTVDGYYRTLFHELGHSTGHKDRLNREGIAKHNGFGTERYSREELVAEMTAAIMCDHVGLDSLGEGGHDGPGVTQSAAYIQHWLSSIKDDPKVLVWAASRADKAADLILAASGERHTEPQPHDDDNADTSTNETVAAA